MGRDVFLQRRSSPCKTHAGRSTPAPRSHSRASSRAREAWQRAFVSPVCHISRSSSGCVIAAHHSRDSAPASKLLRPHGPERGKSVVACHSLRCRPDRDVEVEATARDATPGFRRRGCSSKSPSRPRRGAPQARPPRSESEPSYQARLLAHELAIGLVLGARRSAGDSVPALVWHLKNKVTRTSRYTSRIADEPA